MSTAPVVLLYRQVGRTIGVLLLQIVVAPLVNFVMLKPVFAAPGFLANAAPHASRVPEKRGASPLQEMEP